MMSVHSFSQDLEKIGKKDMFTINGGLGVTSMMSQTQGIPQRRQPFTWMLNGNVTGSFLGISLPFVFSYSNNQVNYSQTYNIKSFNPTYKWFKGYAGTTSMNFSSYTMSGHVFNGGGIELSPKKFRFAALFGQFRKAVEYDALNESDLNMSYRRMGGGFTVGYENGSHAIKVVYFTARDDRKSLRFIPVNTEIKPMENSVISISGRTQLIKKISLDVEYALNSLNRNTYVSDNSARVNSVRNLVFSNDAGSVLFSALKASVSYRLKFAGIAFNYEKVDPGYQTLGAYYFNNDLINYSLAPSLSLMDGKLNFSVNAGLQKNNLDNLKLNTTRRFVAAGNLTFAPNAKWNIMASYSNFNSFTRQRPATDPFYRNTLDTLNFYQISQSSILSLNYQFGDKSLKQNISINGSYQKSGQMQGAISDNGFYNPVAEVQTPARNFNANSSYNLMLAEKRISFSLIGNFNRSYFNESNVVFYGPGINAGKSLLKNKLKFSAGSTFNRAQTNGALTANVLSGRLSCTYLALSGQKTGNLNLSSSVAATQRFAVVKSTPSFFEINGNLSINYTF